MANERILYMKVLVISDIHANIRALDTILREEADYDLSLKIYRRISSRIRHPVPVTSPRSTIAPA